MTEMIPVVSSNVGAVGYEAGNLYVDFVNGTQYVYRDVPENVHRALMTADSIGKFLNSDVKPHFEYEKVN